MIISREGSFVFIANTKTATTTVESLLKPYATIAFTDNPETKHIGITRYLEVIAPTIPDIENQKIESYSIVRDPIDWLFSWYRYRARPEIEHTNRSTAKMSFDEFVQSYLEKPRPEFAKVGSPTGLLRFKGKQIAVDHVYAFEHLPQLIQDLGERLGQELSLDRHLNRSPEKDFEISPQNYLELEKLFKGDMEVYQKALNHPRRITAA